MKLNTFATKEQVYEAVPFTWENPYAVISNKDIMDKIEDNLHQLGWHVESEQYRAARTTSGLIKGVIGEWNIRTDDGEFGQRIAFRNSYDKSMSFAFVSGAVVWICSNGCISGDYGIKRVHKGDAFDDAMASINEGFELIDTRFKDIKYQMNCLKDVTVDKELSYKLIGDLFFDQSVISIEQLSIIKKEMYFSQNFKHIDQDGFTAYDLYNHITESLKKSHPLNYVDNHVKTHSLFENEFNLPKHMIIQPVEEPVEIITPELV